MSCLIINDKILARAKWTKLNRKFLYHFAFFTLINELLIYKNFQICAAYHQMQTSDKIAQKKNARSSLLDTHIRVSF